MFRRSLVVSVFAAMISFPCNVRAQDAANGVEITLERTRCYGFCPIYKISVTGDGLVTYEGRGFVRIVGKRERKIGSSAVQKLVQEFEAIHYFELEDKYEEIKNPDGTTTRASDLPTTFTSLSLSGRTKKIEAYFGVPEELDRWAKTIDDVTGSRRWVTIDAEAVREEVHRGWDVRSPEATALLIKAAAAGDAETVKAFIVADANVNANNEFETPIQVARGADVVRLLVAAGANVNGQVSGKNSDPALHNAARWGDVDTVRELLKDGAQIDGRAWDGSTALMRAAEAGKLEIVRTLLEAGASVRETDANGYDVMMCLRNGQVEGTNYLYGKRREIVEARFQKVRELLAKAGAATGANTEQ